MRKILFGILLFIAGLLILAYRSSIPLEKLKDKYVTEYSEFLPIEGMNAHFEKRGDGTPLLLIHGTSSSLHTWNQWVEPLSKFFTVYSIDMPGGGLTGPHPENDYSIDAYIQYLDAFCDQLGLDSIYIAGNSLGGKIAWKYASRSSRVKKLVLVDPSGFYSEDRKTPFVFKIGKMQGLSKVVERINVKPFINKSLKEVYYDDELITPEIQNRYNDFLRRKGNRKAFFQKVASIGESKVEELQKIQCPTLLQWGDEDIWLPDELSVYYTENIPNHQLIIYENCGHVPQEEIPEKSVKDVIQFLTSKNEL